ncbi:sulfatase [Cohnella soli]|uniref:Sulfatase n=1 Tax=Cohnella soli TaxID=425005 RepID=A0ABW0HU73_9BACL
MSEPLNILVLIVDQMQSFSLGANGNPDVKTPNIDRLAAEGANFNRAYCNNPVCMPSRATLLTGLTPKQHGCFTNGTNLPEHIPTLPQVLARHGYRTHAAGKLHHQSYMSPANPIDPERPWSMEDNRKWKNGEIAKLPENYYGYQSADFIGGHIDVWGEYAQEMERKQPGFMKKYSEAGAYYSHPEAPMCYRIDVPEELHYNRWIADHSIAFMKDCQSSGQPFFEWCSFPDPHFPFVASNPYSEMYDPASLSLPDNWEQKNDMLEHLVAYRNMPQYQQAGHFTESALREIIAQTYGAITHVDTEIGRMVNFLEQSGLLPHTLIIFMADHGEYLGSHHLLTKGEWPWEEGVRVPYIWRDPQGSQALGRTHGHVVSLLDFVPTVLEYAGIDQREMDTRGFRHSQPLGLPGRSLYPFLRDGRPLPDLPAYIEYDEDWLPASMCRMRAIVTGQYKLAIFALVHEGILIDLERDPHETRNLWDDPQYQHIRAELTEQLLMELARTGRLDLPRITGA